MAGRILLVPLLLFLPGCYEDGTPRRPARPLPAITAYEAAQTALKAGDTAEALAQAEAAVAADATFDEAQWLQASLLGREGRLDEALEVCGVLTARSPDFAQAHLLQGILWDQSDDAEAAARCYDAALRCYAVQRETEPLGRDEQLLEAVVTFLRHGELEGVLAINRFLKRFPEHPIALYVKACMQDKDRSFLLRWFSEGGGEGRTVPEQPGNQDDVNYESEAPAQGAE